MQTWLAIRPTTSIVGLVNHPCTNGLTRHIGAIVNECDRMVPTGFDVGNFAIYIKNPAQHWQVMADVPNASVEAEYSNQHH